MAEPTGHEPGCTGAIVQNSQNFYEGAEHAGSMLVQAGAPNHFVAWDQHLQQVASLGMRVVKLSNADVAQLAELAYTLQQYPRVKFAVICNPLICSEGSGAHAALQSVLTGNSY